MLLFIIILYGVLGHNIVFVLNFRQAYKNVSFAFFRRFF